jgi:hypothetical protein
MRAWLGVGHHGAGSKRQHQNDAEMVSVLSSRVNGDVGGAQLVGAAGTRQLR